MFLGSTTNTIDAKGRVSVPAPFRDVVSDEAIYVWPSVHGGFLEGGGKALMEALQREIFDRVAEGSLSPEAAEAQQMALLGGARRLPYDKTGRMVLPEEFRNHADLGINATFVGLGNRFEIWEPGAHEDRMRAAREVSKTTRLLGAPRFGGSAV